MDDLVGQESLIEHSEIRPSGGGGEGFSHTVSRRKWEVAPAPMGFKVRRRLPLQPATRVETPTRLHDGEDGSAHEVPKRAKLGWVKAGARACSNRPASGGRIMTGRCSVGCDWRLVRLSPMPFTEVGPANLQQPCLETRGSAPRRVPRVDLPMGPPVIRIGYMFSTDIMINHFLDPVIAI